MSRILITEEIADGIASGALTPGAELGDAGMVARDYRSTVEDIEWVMDVLADIGMVQRTGAGIYRVARASRTARA